MKRIIVLIIPLLLLTACSVKYDLVINEDLTIIEEAKLTGTQDFFANYYKTTKKNIIKSFLEQYQDILNDNGYQYELVEDEIPFVNLKKKYENISNFTQNSILFNDYFDEIKYIEDGKIKKIETFGFNENNPEDPNRFDVKELTISITCPYKVKNHNAKKVNKKTNTYYYELSNNNKILLEFDVSKKFNKYENMIITIIICLLIIIFTWVTIYILNKKKKS